MGEFTTVRHGDVWFSVKREPENRPAAGSDHSHDLRYDAGLNGLKVRTPDGAWTDVLPPRPFTDVTTDVDTAGPVIAKPGPLVRPVGMQPLRITPAQGTVTLISRFQRHTGTVVRGTSRCASRRSRAGCRSTFRPRPVNAGGTQRSSAASPRVEGPSVTDGQQRVTVSAPFGVEVLSRYASGLDGGLRRVRITATPAATGPLVITICRADAAQP